MLTQPWGDLMKSHAATITDDLKSHYTRSADGLLNMVEDSTQLPWDFNCASGCSDMQVYFREPYVVEIKSDAAVEVRIFFDV